LNILNMTPFEREMVMPFSAHDPIDLKNGVLFFDCVNVTFARSLSEYIETHKNIEIISIAPSLWNDSYGAHCMGYIVVSKTK